MSSEMIILLFSVILHFVWIMIPAAKAIQEYGIMRQAGSRDGLPEPSIFLSRARRLVDNSQENLVIFAIFVLMAHVLNVHSEMTVFGAQLYFFGRLTHGIIYLVGWPLVRPLAWAVGLVGTALFPIEILAAF